MNSQRRWQIKMVEQGRCQTCGKPVSKQNKQYCEKHREYYLNLKKKLYREKAEAKAQEDKIIEIL